MSCPVNAENALVTSSASASVTATLANRYLKITGVQATAQSVTQANPSYSLPVTGTLIPNTVNIDCYDSANARVVKPCSVTVFGVRVDKTKTDWARSANGATASSSGDFAGYPAANAISGNLDPSNGTYWTSSLTTGTRNLEVIFAAAKNINEIVLLTIRDVYGTPGMDTVFDTFTAYGAQDFIIYYWNGSAYVAIPGGTVTGNNKVMRRFPVTVNTTKILLSMTASPDGYARVLAFQAIGVV